MMEGMSQRFSVWPDEHWLAVPIALLLAFFTGALYYLLGQKVVEAILVLSLGIVYFLLMRQLTDRISYFVHEKGVTLSRMGQQIHIPMSHITHLEELSNSKLDKPMENWGIPGMHLTGRGVIIHTPETSFLVHPHPKNSFVRHLQDNAQQFHGQLITFHG
jgi:hypothetical protein